MESEKSSIGPEKEYDTLRQEILKRIEMQVNIQNQTIIIVAALLGYPCVREDSSVLDLQLYLPW